MEHLKITPEDREAAISTMITYLRGSSEKTLNYCKMLEEKIYSLSDNKLMYANAMKEYYDNLATRNSQVLKAFYSKVIACCRQRFQNTANRSETPQGGSVGSVPTEEVVTTIDDVSGKNSELTEKFDIMEKIYKMQRYVHPLIGLVRYSGEAERQLPQFYTRVRNIIHLLTNPEEYCITLDHLISIELILRRLIDEKGKPLFDIMDASSKDYIGNVTSSNPLFFLHNPPKRLPENYSYEDSIHSFVPWNQDIITALDGLNLNQATYDVKPLVTTNKPVAFFHDWDFPESHISPLMNSNSNYDNFMTKLKDEVFDLHSYFGLSFLVDESDENQTVLRAKVYLRENPADFIDFLFTERYPDEKFQYVPNPDFNSKNTLEKLSQVDKELEIIHFSTFLDWWIKIQLNNGNIY